MEKVETKGWWVGGDSCTGDGENTNKLDDGTPKDHSNINWPSKTRKETETEEWGRVSSNRKE